MAESVIDQTETVEPYTNASPMAEDEESRIDFFESFWTLYRGRRTILATSVAIFAVATIIAFLLPFQYTSTVSFIPRSSSTGGSMAAALAGQLSVFGGDAFGMGKSSVDQYAGIFKSRSIASQLVKRFDLMRVYEVKKESQAEKVLTSSTTVATDLKSSIISVSVEAKSPAFARDLANAYMDALRETNGRLALSQSSQRRLFFEQQLAKEKDDLADAEVHLKETEEQSGLIAPTGQTQSQIMTIADIRAQIAVRQVRTRCAPPICHRPEPRTHQAKDRNRGPSGSAFAPLQRRRQRVYRSHSEFKGTCSGTGVCPQNTRSKVSRSAIRNALEAI